jgi:cytoskeleton protein RodZ
MMPPEDNEGMRIGEVLKRTRTRQGMEIAEVEDRTKIRTKYLRALENEEWDVLPSPAYARGFLRTYAQVLGLDADALIDEFRRQVESDLPAGQPYTFREPLLERRRHALPGEPRGRGPWALIGLGVIVAVGVLLGIGLLGGDDEGGGGGKQAAKQERRERHQRRERRRERQREREQAQQQAQGPSTVALRLELNSDVQVCLLGSGSEQPLIDDQLLSAGSDEGPYEAASFDLRFPFGYDREQFDLFLNGRKERLPETQGPTAYKITAPAEVKPAEPTEDCP